MAIIMVETTVLVSGPLTRISFQLAKECQGSFVLDLYQDLVNRGGQHGEACEPSSGGFGSFVFPSLSSSSHLSSPIFPCVLLSFPLFGLLFSGQQCVLCVHVLSIPVKYIRHGFWVFLYKENKNFPFRNPLVKATTSILSLASSIERASLLNRVMYDLSVSSSRCLMLIRHAVDFLYLCPL